MNLVSIILGLVIAVLFVLAVRRILRNGSCEACKGHCGACGSVCHCSGTAQNKELRNPKT